MYSPKRIIIEQICKWKVNNGNDCVSRKKKKKKIRKKKKKKKKITQDLNRHAFGERQIRKMRHIG